MTEPTKETVNGRIRGVLARTQSKAKDEDSIFLSADKKGKVAPDVDRRKIHKQILEDEEIRGFYGFIIDAITQAGYKITGKDKAKAEQKLKELKWSKKRKAVYFKCLTENHVFLELIPNAEKTDIVELKLQPAYAMRPVKSERGQLLSYIKEDVDGKEVPFKLDEIAHISVEDYDGRFWNTPQLVTLERLISLKQYVMEHLRRKFEQNEFKQHFHLTGTNADEIEEIVTNMRISQTERGKHLITAGEEKLEGRKMDEESSILPMIELLNKIRNMMLTLIRVPPIIAGTVDNSNRSNSDTQANFTFIMRIESFLRDLEEEINFELFPKLGLEAELTHNNVSLREDKQWFDMANQLVAMGASKDKTAGWLVENGVEIPLDIFEPSQREKQEVEKQDVMGELGVDKLPFAKNSDLFPSRKPQKKDTADYKTGSEASTKE